MRIATSILLTLSTVFLYSYRVDKNLFIKLTSTSGQFDCYETLYLYTDTSYKYYRGSVTYGSWPIDSGNYILTDSLLTLNTFKPDSLNQFGEKSACRPTATKFMRVNRQSKKTNDIGMFISNKRVHGKFLILTNYR